MKLLRSKVFLLVTTVVVVAAIGGLIAFGAMSTSKTRIHKAEEACMAYLPEDAQLIDEELSNGEYDLEFVSYSENNRYELCVEASGYSVTKLESEYQGTVTPGAEVLDNNELQAIVLGEYPESEISSSDRLNERGLDLYNATFRTIDVRGTMLIEASSGVVLERSIHFGSMFSAPELTNDPAGQMLTYEQIVEVINRNYPNAIILDLYYDAEIERDHDDVPHYDARIYYNERVMELELDAYTGETISFEYDDDVVAPPSTAPDQTGLITEQQAREIALAQAKADNAVITRIRLTVDDGRDIYDVDMVDSQYEYDIEIDAKTGSVIDLDVDRLPNQTAAPAPTQSTGNTGLISEDEAREIALAQAKADNAKITRIRLTRDDGRDIYDVDMVDSQYEYDIEIDAKTGKVIDLDVDRLPNQTAAPAPTQSTGNTGLISEAEAREIALAQAKADNAKITRIRLTRDDGRDIYDVDMVDSQYKYDIEIDAKTGKVLDLDVDRLPANTPTPTQQTGNGLISEAEAREIALAQARADNAKITRIRLTRDDGRDIYDVDMVDSQYEYEMEIDAKTGKVIDLDVERIPSNDSVISRERVEEIVKDRLPGCEIKKIELEREHGRDVYEVEARQGGREYDLIIDAYTGEILSMEEDD